MYITVINQYVHVVNENRVGIVTYLSLNHFL